MTKQTMVVGRSLKDSNGYRTAVDIALGAGAVSNPHFEFAFELDEASGLCSCAVRDLDSSNGIRVDGVKVKVRPPIELRCTARRLKPTPGVVRRKK